MQNHVNAIHCCSLSKHDESYIKQVADLLVQAKINVIVCPSAMLNNVQPREKKGPICNSIAPVQQLLNAGVNVALGVDNIHDIFTPFTDGDLFNELRCLINACRIYDITQLVNISTFNGRKALEINRYHNKPFAHTIHGKIEEYVKNQTESIICET